MNKINYVTAAVTCFVAVM